MTIKWKNGQHKRDLALLGLYLSAPEGPLGGGPVPPPSPFDGSVLKDMEAKGYLAGNDKPWAITQSGGRRALELLMLYWDASSGVNGPPVFIGGHDVLENLGRICLLLVFTNGLPSLVEEDASSCNVPLEYDGVIIKQLVEDGMVTLKPGPDEWCGVMLTGKGQQLAVRLFNWYGKGSKEVPYHGFFSELDEEELTLLGLACTRENGIIERKLDVFSAVSIYFEPLVVRRLEKNRLISRTGNAVSLRPLAKYVIKRGPGPEIEIEQLYLCLLGLWTGMGTGGPSGMPYYDMKVLKQLEARGELSFDREGDKVFVTRAGLDRASELERKNGIYLPITWRKLEGIIEYEKEKAAGGRIDDVPQKTYRYGRGP